MNVNFTDRIFKNRLVKDPFVLIYRSKANEKKEIEIFFGEISFPNLLKSIPLEKSPFLKDPSDDTYHRKTLVLVPYKQIFERGFVYREDNAKLITMNVVDSQKISVADFLKICPNESIDLSNSCFDVSDQEYADTVKKVIENEIGFGEGSNFVIKRSFTAEINDYSLNKALSIFRQLLQNEKGAYWTFLINTGNRIFIGASPELHVSLRNNITTMNPISGTYRYPPSGPTLPGIMEFLAASKEVDELYMVVEEELKMMSNFCPEGGTVYGPFLKEMSRLAHTEYFIKGKSTADPREILRLTMFAPTTTGSPLENAFRVISKYEPKGREYYSGIAAIISEDLNENYNLDSAILIRTADIAETGHLEIGVGSTIVRHSNPFDEVAETSAKASALINAMQPTKEFMNVQG